MRRSEQTMYWALLAACLVTALLAGWTPLAERIDNDAYDWMLVLHQRPGPAPKSVILAIDEASLQEGGGVRNLRSILADGLERIADASPKSVAIDLTIADRGDPKETARLAAVLERLPSVVLPADLVPATGDWEEPYAELARTAKAVGHVHVDPDRYDGVSRDIPLEKAVGGRRHWALALEAYRFYAGGVPVLESMRDLQAGSLLIPASRQHDADRPLRILYSTSASIPVISVAALRKNPALAGKFTGRAVFAGVTALSAARDRFMTPYDYFSGVQIHASAFETLAGGRFLVPARDFWLLPAAVGVVALAGVVFVYFSGWPAYLLGALLLVVAHALPHLLFLNGIVYPYFAPAVAAWLGVSAAATFQYFVVRRKLLKSESDKHRYEQTLHHVTHEMRTPLTAIQGSSELMSRYNLNDEKRKQIAQMINSESKRLARMIQTYLDVERLGGGQMALRREPFEVAAVVRTCAERARPLAERKSIALEAAEDMPGMVNGDRELTEYAVYNLVTNAIKYSPGDTTVRISTRAQGPWVSVSVSDQGIGMDEKELRHIFRKFYRTQRAEASGEPGTGIGLSIVDQIVTHHGGKMEVTSAPGKGSCFTMVLPAFRGEESGERAGSVPRRSAAPES